MPFNTLLGAGRCQVGIVQDGIVAESITSPLDTEAMVSMSGSKHSERVTGREGSSQPLVLTSTEANAARTNNALAILATP